MKKVYLKKLHKKCKRLLISGGVYIFIKNRGVIRVQMGDKKQCKPLYKQIVI